MLKNRYVIGDEQWALMEPNYLGKKSGPGRSGSDPRIFLEGVFWIARTGALWRDLPAEFGNWNSAFKRVRHWVKKDVFQLMFIDLSAGSDFGYTMIDGKICKVTPSRTRRKKGDTKPGILQIRRWNDHHNSGFDGRPWHSHRLQTDAGTGA
jgi:transposase